MVLGNVKFGTYTYLTPKAQSIIVADDILFTIFSQRK